MDEKELIRGKPLPIFGIILVVFGLLFWFLLSGVEGAYIFGVAMLIIGVIIIAVYSKSFLIVTDKRISGKIATKTVDLPLDSVSAVSKQALGNIAVSTSSGLIKFGNLTNGKEIYQVISKLIIDRQDRK